MPTLYESILKFENSSLSALYYENKTITYKKLIENIKKLVSYLRDKGIKSGDVVTTVLPNLPITIYLFYALNAIGAIQNIIYPLTPIDQIMDSLKRTSSNHCIMLLTEFESHKDLFINAKTNFYFVNPMHDNSFILRHLIFFKYKAPKNYPNLFLIDKFRSYQPATDIKNHDPSLGSIYLHSGGTTSTPKIIVLSDDSINNLAMKVDGIINHPLQGKSMLAVLPTFHGFGLGMGIHAPLANGASSALMMRFNSQKVIKWINQGKINFIIGVPELYRKLMNDPGFINSKLTNLEYSFVGGDNVHQSLIDNFNQLMIEHQSTNRLLEGYGLTETVTVCTVNTKEHFKKASVGQPLRDIELRIYDDNMNLLKNGEVGEVYISGNTLMNSYLDDEVSTNNTKINIDNRIFIKTGDLGYLDDDGFLFLKGRKKRMFIISGFNVYPGEVEKIVTEIDGVQSASLECFETPKIHLNLYIIKNRNYNKSEQELSSIITQTLKNKLLKYSLPSKIIFLDEFPKTKVGKIDHKKFVDDK